ncbi:MAG: glycosyltransferase, partial [Croceitalea sp.]|nr:glycosyltransferase [Croceitalea sp.]
PNGKITLCNFMQSSALEKAINQSQYILCRSGYTTVMDLAKLEKKAFFIPTPGQYEQEYLAKRLDKQGMVPFKNQDEFELNDLKLVENYQGLTNFCNIIDYGVLFDAFSKVKENSEPIPTSLST